MKTNVEQAFQLWSKKPEMLTSTQQAQLTTLGLELDQKVEPINESLIQQAIDFSNISVVFDTDSTQNNVSANSTLIAEHQSAGVGQRGKSWLTPLGSSVCLSHRFKLNTPISNMSGYALTAASACLQTIKIFNNKNSATIKWPNDLYANGIKFAGILTQVQRTQGQLTEVVLGIGINWQLSCQHFLQIDQPVCNIPIDTRSTTRNQFIIALLKQIQINNNKFEQHGFAAFLTQWQQFDHLKGRQVSVKTAEQIHQGTYAGVSPLGELQLNINNQLHRFASGEAQLLKNHV